MTTRPAASRIRFTMPALLRRLGLAGALCGALTGAALAQSTKSRDQGWKRDPHTQGDATLMRQLGYLSFGPFPWGDDHDTGKIHAMMPEAKILWLETAHFRIGSSLGPLTTPKSSRARKRLHQELTQLATRLPGVKAKTKVLSRWLRLHLYADRLERLYQRWQTMLGVNDQDFPKTGAIQLPETAKSYMGRGPYLGMPDKFSILLLKKAGNLTRYAVKNGLPMPKAPTPVCLNFIDRGGILFGSCSEIVHHSLDPDHRLHSHMLFNTCQLLIRGYKHYSFRIPAWVREGTANSFVRAHDPEEHDFSGMQNWNKNKAYPKKWAVYARRLAKNGFAPSSRKLCSLFDANQMSFNDHICAWSRVDYLRQLDHGKKFARFLALLKHPVRHDPGKNPSEAAVLAQQTAALQAAFGYSFEDFDAAWTKYALKAYPRR